MAAIRILFLTHYFHPEGNAPASRVLALGKRWVKAGHQVTVITCAPNVPNGVVYPGYKNRWCQRETVEGIEVVRVWTYIAANEGTVLRILNYLSYMVTAAWRALRMPRPDLVVATSPQFFCGWAGIIAARLRRVPLVLEIRDIWPESIAAVEAIENRRVLRFVEYLERKMYEAPRRIVTVGDGYRRRLIEKGVPESKLDVVMNGLDTEIFSPRPPDRELARRWNLEGKFVCSYIGTIGLACGLDTVLKAAVDLKEHGHRDVVFLLVGDGAKKTALADDVRRQELDNVRFTGRQDKQTIPDWLAVSNACLVHLKKTELFKTVMPSKIFEAAGMARPIINGVSGFAEDFVKKAGAGICIEPENVQQLVEAVLYLKNNPEEAARMGESGRNYVFTRYNRDKLAGDYLKILERVGNSGSDRGVT